MELTDPSDRVGQRASAGVLNARWVKPLDPRLAGWAERYQLLVTIEDNVVTGGFGAAVLESLSGAGLAGKVRTLGIADDFQPFGSASAILARNGLDAESVAGSVAGFMAASESKR